MMDPSYRRSNLRSLVGSSCGAREKSARLRLGAVGVSAEGRRAACNSPQRGTGISQLKSAIDCSVMGLPHRTGANSTTSRDSQGRQEAAKITCAAARRQAASHPIMPGRSATKQASGRACSHAARSVSGPRAGRAQRGLPRFIEGQNQRLMREGGAQNRASTAKPEKH